MQQTEIKRILTKHLIDFEKSEFFNFCSYRNSLPEKEGNLFAQCLEIAQQELNSELILHPDYTGNIKSNWFSLTKEGKQLRCEFLLKYVI